ncbi:hypothetical protein B0T14DRAFT_601127 [Immersiella caudata]|uniref:Uncharacterized protein n=1 Tax=Immersiella caudata TaxID=314043 RepID=A0AA40C276_9PEZI|nr:hypothetical protein B0T14DRAFT_601127 [Immersiella caudata]
MNKPGNEDLGWTPSSTLTHDATSRFFPTPDLLLCLAEQASPLSARPSALQLPNQTLKTGYQRNLSHLCLTNHALHAVLTPPLYSHLNLYIGDILRFRLDTNPHLHHTHTLTVQYPRSLVTLAHQQAFTQLLSHTPNLQSLQIDSRRDGRSPLQQLLSSPLRASSSPISETHPSSLTQIPLPTSPPFTRQRHITLLNPPEDYTAKNPESRRPFAPLFLALCLTYAKRGEGAAPLRLKALVVAWRDPPSINGEKAWKEWVDTVGVMVDFGVLEVLRLGNTSVGEDPQTRCDLLPALISDLVPRLRLLIVPKYTPLVHDWAVNLEPEFARQVGLRYVNKVELKGGTGLTMADLFMEKRPCELRMVKLELDVEEARGYKILEIFERLAATNSSTLQLLDLQGLRLDTSTRETLVNLVSKLVCVREIRILNFVGLHRGEELSLVTRLARSQATLQNVVLSSRGYHVLRRHGGSEVLGIHELDTDGICQRGLELCQWGWPSIPFTISRS